MTGFFYEIIYTALISVAAALCYIGAAGTEVIVWAPVCAALVPAVLLTLVTHMKARERAMLLGILAAGLAGAFLVRKHIEDHFSIEDHPWLIPVILISVICFAAGVLAARHTSVRIAVSVCALALLVLSLLSFIDVPVAGVFCAMAFILLCVVTEVSIRWKKEGNTDIRMYMVCTAPFLAVIMLSAALIHYPEKPYDWRFFVNAWSRVVDIFDRISFNFDTGQDLITGFSDDGMLYASLRSGNTDVLSVTTIKDLNSPIYIAGTVFDRFDGHGWKSTDNSDLPMHALDAVESMSAVNALGLSQRDYYREIPFVLEYTDTKTKYLFAPTKLVDRSIISGKAATGESGGALMFEGYNSWHMKVSETYLRVNADNPGFYEFMKDPSVPDAESWSQAVGNMKPDMWDGALSYDRYLEYSKHIKKVYSGDIKLSAGVSEKLDRLYDGAQSGYERMKRLEGALSLMEYSLDPPDIPASVKDPSSYLDFFLLESGKGYCSYYASAFVLLAREQGLPARYVQGYRVPVGRKGTYTVTSDMAHAWPEVYFEGRGWIAFDPTPGFFKESEWTMSTLPTAADTPSAPAQDVFERAVDETANEKPGEEEEEEEKIYIDPAVVAVPFFAVLLFLAVFMMIGRMIARARLKRLCDRDKLALISRDCLEILKLSGSGIREGETLSEYRERIRKETGDEALLFIPCYETVLYDAGGTVDPEIAYNCRPVLMRYLRTKSRFRYLFKLIKG